MAEYGVTLTVITLAVVGVFTAFNEAMIAAVNRAVSLIPG